VSDCVAALEDECRKERDRSETNAKAQHERYLRELKAAKDAWAAGEKGRLDKALAAQVDSVREATIRGLEPEIQRLMDKHR
jgi:5-azacytidine-induced protein 1